VCWRAQTVKDFRFLCPADSPQLSAPSPLLPIVATTATTAMATEAASITTTTTPLSQRSHRQNDDVPHPKQRRDSKKSNQYARTILLSWSRSSVVRSHRRVSTNACESRRLQAFHNSGRATEHRKRLFCSVIANEPPPPPPPPPIHANR